MLAFEEKRWQEAQDISLHDVEQEALCQGGLGDGPGGLGDFEAEQKAATTGLYGDGTCSGKLLELTEEIGAGVGDLREQTLVFDDLEVLEAEAAGERTSAEGAAVFGHTEGVEELFVDHERAEGDAAAEGLAQDESVGLNAGAGVGEPVARSTEAALDLVEDEESVVLVGDATGFDEEGVVDDMNAALAKDRLEENSSGRVGNGGTKLLEVVAVDEGDVREAGAKVETVLLLPGDRERAVGAAVVGVSQGDDAVLGVMEVLAGMGARELQGTLDGLGAAGGVEDTLETGEMAETLGELAGVAAGVERGYVDEFGGLIGHGRDHARVSVTEGVDTEACHEIEVAIAGGVVQINSVAMVHDDGITGVDGEKGFRLAGKNTVGVGILPKIKHNAFITQEEGVRVKYCGITASKWVRGNARRAEPSYSELRMGL